MATKRVAYLLGAGASEGILKYEDSEKSIILSSITDAIAKRVENNPGDFKEVREELQNNLVEGANIEHLITLYEVSSHPKHTQIAKDLKRLFRDEIQKRMTGLGTDFSPRLLLALIDMHSIDKVGEKLVLILTTNYEDLIERALQKMDVGINYVVGVNYNDSHYKFNEKATPLLKLHGSFNWENGYPITVQGNVVSQEETVWIPPGVTKRKESYPFNIIWGRAKELLDCEILRIIGSSLTQTDWELISLIHSTQRLRTDGNLPFAVEFIGHPKACKRIKEDYPYLNPKTYIDMDEFVRFAEGTYLPNYIGRSGPPDEVKLVEVAETIDKGMNVFELWLKSKGEILSGQDISLHTTAQYFENFVNDEG